MDAIAATGLGGGDDRFDVEVAAYGVTADLARRARQPGVQRHRIRLGEDRHRIDAERRRRPGDADRDLAAIGDQDALEHVYSPRSLPDRALPARS
jgi:hypothetical protein